MRADTRQQQGASAIAILILLAVIGAGLFVAFQYVPQLMLAGTFNSILGSIEKTHEDTPYKSVDAIQEAISKQLSVNQVRDHNDNFKVTDGGNAYVIEIDHDWELNLLFKTETIEHDKTVTLKK